jgi:hypothetical protein
MCMFKGRTQKQPVAAATTVAGCRMLPLLHGPADGMLWMWSMARLQAPTCGALLSSLGLSWLLGWQR